MSWVTRKLGLLLLAALAWTAWTAWMPSSCLAQETRRFGLFVGQNDGGKDTHRLLYAESDAERLKDLLERIGALDSRFSELERDVRQKDVLASLRKLKGRIRDERELGRRTVLYFYYSGHADKDGLKLGNTQLGMDELKQALRDTGADLRVVLLDACQSGAATRSKGGKRAPSFLVQVEEGEKLQGEVIITSSAAEEASQESDRVGGGYFTHHLVAGLLGAADASRDGQVTLEEAYAYTYHRTLFETAGSAGGLQHPSIQNELRGYGSLVLTRPAQGQTVLVFPSGLEGKYLVFDRDRKLFVAELQLNGKEERHLALPAGRYLIQKREVDHLLTAELVLTRGTQKSLEEQSLVRSGFEDDFSKGVTRANVRRATRSPLVLSAVAGVRTFMREPSGALLFPSSPLFGLELEWGRVLGGRWSFTSEFAAGASLEDIRFEGYDYDIKAVYRQVVFGVGLEYGGEWGPLEWGIGPRIGAFYIRRDFPGTTEPFQDFFNVVPGVGGAIDFRISRRVSFGLLGLGHYLYYYADNENHSLGYWETLLRSSIRL